MVSDNIAAIPLRAGSGPDDRALARVFTAYIVSATIWLVFATAVGLLDSFIRISRRRRRGRLSAQTSDFTSQAGNVTPQCCGAAVAV